MLQSMGLQRDRHELAAEQQQYGQIYHDFLSNPQWAPRDTCGDSRGERGPLLPLESSSDSQDASGMQPRDRCRPWRGILGPGHKPRCKLLEHLQIFLNTYSKFLL